MSKASSAAKSETENATVAPNAALSDVTFDTRGLVPVIAQDRLTGEIRMVAFANNDALTRTLETKRATFFSRSRNALWEKGAESGNRFEVGDVIVDCDTDAILYSGDPLGPTCHTGTASCFQRSLSISPNDSTSRDAASDRGDAADPETLGRPFLLVLESTIDARRASTGDRSYTKSLFERGTSFIGSKIQEEAAELAAALASESNERVASEAADVLFHLMVGLRHRNIGIRDVLAALAARTGQSGHEEKASREKTTDA